MNPPALVLPLLLAIVFTLRAHAAEALEDRRKIETVRFSNLPEEAASQEVRARLHSLEIPAPLSLTQESFQLYLPSHFKNDGSWGLLVWISPSESPRIPEPWIDILSRHRLLCIGANNSGNKRDIFDRIALAVSANMEMRSRLKLNPQKMYVAGFSGGGRVASMLGVAYADLFKGSVAMMGANFYTDLPSPDGRTLFPPQYIPDDEVLQIARQSASFVLLTGEKDFNRPEMKIVFERGFRKEGFTRLRYLEVPGIGHALPDAEWFHQALQFLDSYAP